MDFFRQSRPLRREGNNGRIYVKNVSWSRSTFAKGMNQQGGYYPPATSEMSKGADQ